VAVVVAFSIITFLHVVLGELVPKMFAPRQGRAVRFDRSEALEWFAKIFSPILWVLNYAGRLVGKAIGISASLNHTSIYTEDEIRHLITLSQESGQINEEERTLINKVFEFSKRQLKRR
jgi:CBS domain containing-hemolysin-like protein